MAKVDVKRNAYYDKIKGAIGNKYGLSKLTILKFEQRQGKYQKSWHAYVSCECGTEKWVLWTNLKYGLTRSCGCVTRQRGIEALAVCHKTRQERRESILKMVAENPALTLQEVGDHFGVSREWIRQVLKTSGFIKPNSLRRIKQYRDEIFRLRAFINANGLQVPVFHEE